MEEAALSNAGAGRPAAVVKDPEVLTDNEGTQHSHLSFFFVIFYFAAQ